MKLINSNQDYWEYLKWLQLKFEIEAGLWEEYKKTKDVEILNLLNHF